MTGTDEKKRTSVGRAAYAMLVIDIAALVGFYLIMPSLRRPFEMLMGLSAALFAMTAVSVKRNILRNGLIIAASVAFALFLLEMGEKFLNFTEWPSLLSAPDRTGGDGACGWNSGDPGSYLIARDTARKDGIDPEALTDNLAGDIFAGRDRTGLLVAKRAVGVGAEAVTEGYTRFYATGTDLGYEHTPDNLVREYVRDKDSGRFVCDVAYRIDSHGFRETRGNTSANEAYVFIGDSFTFGAFLNGEETAAHYFSQAHGFSKKVLNLGTMGWGPHHVLRDLELGRRLDPALGNSAVRGVYYTLIDAHADRLMTAAPKYMTTPRYVLNDAGRVEFRDRSAGGGLRANLALLLDKSRLYPVLRERLRRRLDGDGPGYKWRLAVAILVEIDRLCRERYGVPLTVVYWDDKTAVMDMLRAAGVETVHISDALPEGKDWRRASIKYLVFDGHPSAYANRMLARHLFLSKSREGH